MKAIFLDVDGVLNSARWYQFGRRDSQCQGREKSIDPAAVGLLNQLHDRTGAHIVVSSTWRLGPEYALGFYQVQADLIARGLFAPVIAATPCIGSPRGNEIQTWIDNRVRNRFAWPESIVILDDDSDMADLMPYLVKTSFQTGLTADDVDRAVEVLSRPYEPPAHTVRLAEQNRRPPNGR